MIKDTFDARTFSATKIVMIVMIDIFFLSRVRGKTISRKEENYYRLPSKSHKCRFLRHAIAFVRIINKIIYTASARRRGS